MDQLLVQTLQDSLRVIMVLDVLIIATMVYGGVSFILKIIGKLIIRGWKAIWSLIRRTPIEPVMAVTEEPNVEV